MQTTLYYIIAMNADFMKLRMQEVFNIVDHLKLCNNLKLSVHAQILTRLQEPPCEVIDAAFDKLVKCGIPLDAILVEDQEDCKVCFEKP